jgi:hypothetical protein
MNLKNILIRALQGGYKIPHARVREMFDLQGSSYEATPNLPTLFMYDAFMLCYSSTRDDVEAGFWGAGGQWHTGGSVADTWAIAATPKKYPFIEKREGTAYLPESDKDGSYLKNGLTGPQVMYNYYQGEFGGPKLAIMIVDAAQVVDSPALECSRYAVAEPVRFALFAKQDWKNNAMGGNLTITHIYRDGRYLPLDDETVGNALAYGKALFEQIKAGRAYDPAKALTQSAAEAAFPSAGL